MDHHHDDESGHGHDHDHDHDEHGAHGAEGGGGGGSAEAFDPENEYDHFPPGEALDAGGDAGFGEIVQLNLRSWFTADAQANSVIDAFLRAFEEEGVTFSYLQLKSSSRESEWLIHKPHLILPGGHDRSGIRGKVEGYREGTPISSFVVNHQRTLAFRPTRTLMVTDGEATGMMIHKGENGM
jgi:hypothetical protein